MTSPSKSQLVFVIGTRAQLIKVAPVVVACERIGLPATLLMTGQHQETMQDLIEEFGIRSPQVLAIPAGEHSTIRSLLRWLPSAYFGVKARLRELAQAGGGLDVLVHGDTLSTIVGAWAGRRCRARVVHLESGLSSGRLFDPFPEELCRRLVFRLADVAMCPNPEAAEYMRRHHHGQVVDTGGNTIIDAVALSGATPAHRDASRPYLVASLHRFQNIYNAARFHALIDLIVAVSAKYPVHFVLHPATRNRLGKDGLMAKLEAAAGVKLSPRLGYGEFLRLAAEAACVLTDGGSNQEELATLGVPTVVMRETTERPDGLGANAMMEADVLGGVQQFILDGRFEQLRRAPSVAPELGPSMRVAQALAGDGGNGVDAKTAAR
jgi:UDP-N-acetylglucosamine 2-epimerase (non-hydrolysing)